tara:strand:+ start:128 stop:919 length:792 start_codon:yes stop_codon:yes gene_type:complete
VTSPPYWGLRDYGESGQLGLEDTPEEYVESMVKVFREVRRVLKDDGTLWLNLGDSYNGSGVTSLKPKDLVGLPWMVAFALRANGWYLRQDIIWHKPNPMPESVTDRCTKSHEYIFLFSKSPKYYYDIDAIREDHTTQMKTLTWAERKALGDTSGNREAEKFNVLANGMSKGQHPNGRNKRSVWTVTTKPYKGAHFAVFPTELITPCVLAGTKAGDVILDPFGGSGTTGKVSIENGRKAIMCELNPEYVEIIEKRTTTTIGFGF